MGNTKQVLWEGKVLGLTFQICPHPQETLGNSQQCLHLSGCLLWVGEPAGVGQAPFGWGLSLSPPPGHPLTHTQMFLSISVLRLGFQVLQQLWPFLAQGGGEDGARGWGRVEEGCGQASSCSGTRKWKEPGLGVTFELRRTAYAWSALRDRRGRGASRHPGTAPGANN